MTLICFLFFDENVVYSMFRSSCMICAHFNIVVYLWLLDANIGTPLIFAPVVKG